LKGSDKSILETDSLYSTPTGVISNKRLQTDFLICLCICFPYTIS
jgi:hypothetical protein